MPIARRGNCKTKKASAPYNSTVLPVRHGPELKCCWPAMQENVNCLSPAPWSLLIFANQVGGETQPPGKDYAVCALYPVIQPVKTALQGYRAGMPLACAAGGSLSVSCPSPLPDEETAQNKWLLRPTILQFYRSDMVPNLHAVGLRCRSM